MVFSSKGSTVSQELKNIFKEVHWSHDVFILHTERKQCDEKKNASRANSRGKEMCRDVQLTFWQQSMNSSMVTTPSLFLSIFCWREEKIMMKRGFLKPLCCDWQWQSGERCQRHTCLKEDFYMLTRRLLFEDGVCAFSHHVVDGLHDV